MSYFELQKWAPSCAIQCHTLLMTIQRTWLFRIWIINRPVNNYRKHMVPLLSSLMSMRYMHKQERACVTLLIILRYLL